jgi:hypothetical protein
MRPKWNNDLCCQTSTDLSQSFSTSRPILDWKSKAKPVQVWIGPECSRSLRLPHSKIKLSALGTGRLYPPGNILGTRFCHRLSQPQGHIAAGSTVCPTRYRTQHFFNNSNTNEDIATKFEQGYVRCVRNEEECVCSPLQISLQYPH